MMDIFILTVAKCTIQKFEFEFENVNLFKEKKKLTQTLN